MTKPIAAILFGGSNSEHEVSLMSSTSVLKNIDRERYEVVMLGITRDGRWLEYRGPVEKILSGEWEGESDFLCPAFISPDRGIHGYVRLRDGKAETQRVDVAFPVMHGKYAEDGTMQGLFALAGIPCVGPGTCASAICMDKEYAHLILERVGVPTAKWVCIRKEEENLGAAEELVEKKLGGYPVFVKPANAGSSVGVSKANSKEELTAAMALAFENDSKIIIEEMIHGKEVESAVLGNEDPIAAQMIGEIAPSDGFYGYEAKYLDDTAGLFIPARVDDATRDLLKETAVKAYKALGCQGLSRVDFFVRGEGDIILNELNTLPGFTHISMYPKLFIASGTSYPELITKLLEAAMVARY